VVTLVAVGYTEGLTHGAVMHMGDLSVVNSKSLAYDALVDLRRELAYVTPNIFDARPEGWRQQFAKMGRTQYVNCQIWPPAYPGPASHGTQEMI
jgi:hypothetical protein